MFVPRSVGGGTGPFNQRDRRWFQAWEASARAERYAPATESAGAAHHVAGAGVDVDPDHLAVAHEFEAVAARAGIELGAEIVGAAHLGQDAGFDVAEREVAALLRLAPGAAATRMQSAARMTGRDLAMINFTSRVNVGGLVANPY